MTAIAFVAGATGHTGREVVAALRARGARTVAHVRPDSRDLDAWKKRFGELGAEVDTTPWEAAAMAETILHLAPTHVFALLGTTRARAKREAKQGVDPSKNSYATVDVGMTKIVLDACVASRRKPRFLYLSAAGTTESPSGDYLKARATVEKLLRESGLPYVIARPSFIVGERDEHRAGESIGASVSDGLLKVAGALGARKLRDRYTSTTNVVLARALVRAALDEERADVVLESEALR